MLSATRHMLTAHLLDLPRVLDRYAAADPAFVGEALAWLSSVEQTLLKLRRPLAGQVASARGRILGAKDGYRPNGAVSSGTTPRQAQRAVTAAALTETDNALRDIITGIDTRLDGYREKIAQLLAVASHARPLPTPGDQPRDPWLRSLWSDLATTPDTAGMHAYLKAALAPGDALDLLGELVDNLLGQTDDTPLPGTRAAGAAPEGGRITR
ncbi:hypothetical protein RM780_02295 [Streptomyces sp. DSM 44917]|uniref:Uncharacterized protein n=1 Tax=Streptomyces boetiae TaxID=3075541 RepID=A0ABU2L2L3_9ACTN|nr:hypothetical protein [Streptomyces sp. DSM 44917]MDT0305794.1 hypothetical protein [Streptomyces sp. DSM 44917]